MTTDTILNAAFIGCGAIAQKKHLPLSLENPAIHIKAMFDVNRDAAQRCRSEFGSDDTMLTNSAEDIFARDDIDLVFVSTPNNTHAAYSIAALNSGKHVVCEKPMAISSADAQDMLDASRKNGRYLHVSFQNRYTNQALYVRRLADEGFFSGVYYAKALAIRRRAAPTWGVTTNKAFQGGGPLIDIGSHAIDLALWLSDNFDPDYAVGTTYDKIARRGSDANYWGAWNQERFEVEDCALGFVVMKNGMTLTVDATYALNTSVEQEASVDLFGVSGGAHLREQDGVTLVHEIGGKMNVSTNDLQKSFRGLTPAGSTKSASAREHDDIVRQLLAGVKTDPAAVQALAIARIVEGLYQSAASRTPFEF